MEESHKKDLQLAIKVQFNKHPLLPTLVKNPTHYLQSPWTQLISQQLQSQFGTRGDGVFYRIVFSPGASGELMTIQKGPLAGLQTTSVVEDLGIEHLVPVSDIAEQERRIDERRGLGEGGRPNIPKLDAYAADDGGAQLNPCSPELHH